MLACVAVPLTVMLVRPLWVFPMTYLPALVRRPATRAARGGSGALAVPAGISWAGMRGVVTLAAAFVLPATRRTVRS